MYILFDGEFNAEQNYIIDFDLKSQNDYKRLDRPPSTAPDILYGSHCMEVMTIVLKRTFLDLRGTLFWCNTPIPFIHMPFGRL